MARYISNLLIVRHQTKHVLCRTEKGKSKIHLENKLYVLKFILKMNFNT